MWTSQCAANAHFTSLCVSMWLFFLQLQTTEVQLVKGGEWGLCQTNHRAWPRPLRQYHQPPYSGEHQVPNRYQTSRFPSCLFAQHWPRSVSDPVINIRIAFSLCDCVLTPPPPSPACRMFQPGSQPCSGHHPGGVWKSIWSRWVLPVSHQVLHVWAPHPLPHPRL